MVLVPMAPRKVHSEAMLTQVVRAARVMHRGRVVAGRDCNEREYHGQAFHRPFPKSLPPWGFLAYRRFIPIPYLPGAISSQAWIPQERSRLWPMIQF